MESGGREGPVWKGPEEGKLVRKREEMRASRQQRWRGGKWVADGRMPGGVGTPALARPQGQALGGLEGIEVQKLMQRMEKQREPEGPAWGQGSSAGEEAAVVAQQSSGGR